jgi:hypothetical protein
MIEIRKAIAILIGKFERKRWHGRSLVYLGILLKSI